MTAPTRRTVAFGAAAILSFAVAAVLALLAADTWRWQERLAHDDARYPWSPPDGTLWQGSELVPFGAAAGLLAVNDDRELREAIRSLRAARLEDAVVSDPELALRRNEAQARLEAIVDGELPAAWRSRAAGLLGVLGLSRFMYETEDREALLAATVSSLRRALELDPSNDEAKVNLELAYQRGRGLELTEGSAGANPSPGGSGSKGAGAGDAGSGY